VLVTLPQRIASSWEKKGNDTLEGQSSSSVT